jgi:hypothetical protein
MSTTVTIPMRLRCDTHGDHDKPVVWWYCSSDPYTIRLEFEATPPDDPVVWEFARDLLAAGLHDVAGVPGLGDVIIWPGRGRICMLLDSPDGSIRLSASRRDITALVRVLGRVVPFGAERVDVDGAIAALLGTLP